MKRFKKALFFISLVFVGIFLVSHRAEGFVFDLASLQLEAISEKTGPIMGTLWGLTFFYSVSLSLLSISAALLQGVLIASPNAIVISSTHNPFVGAGWHFSLLIANLFFVVAFIVIAFSVIFKLENIQVKKALPNLIAAALLANFTLLFVGMAVDVSNFFYNTILAQFITADGGTLLGSSLEPVMGNGWQIVLGVLAFMAAIVIPLLVPYVNVAVQTGMVLGLPALIPIFIMLLVNALIMISMAGVFFLFFFVFLARIFVIQLLAIFAPFAFVALIFPQTKKHFDLWLKSLVEWLFVGVIFFFLLFMGFALSDFLSNISDQIVASFQFPGFINFFTAGFVGQIVLLVYWLIILGVGKKMIPSAASMAISQATSFAKTATPWAANVGKGSSKYYRQRAIKRDQDASKEGASTSRSPFSRIAAASGEMESKVTKWAHQASKTTVEREAAKDVESAVNKISSQFKGDVGSAIAVHGQTAFRSDKAKSTPTEQAALAAYLAKEGGDKAIDKLDPNVKNSAIRALGSLSPGDFKKAIAQAPGLFIDDANKGLRPMIEQIMLKGGMEDGDAKAILENHSKISEDFKKAKESGNQEEIKKMENLVKEEAIFKKLADKLENSEIKNLSSSSINNERFLEHIARSKSMRTIQTIGEEKGSDVVRKLDDVIKVKLVETGDLEKSNFTLAGQIQKTPAAQKILPETYKEIKARTPETAKKEEKTKTDAPKIQTKNLEAEWRKYQKERDKK